MGENKCGTVCLYRRVQDCAFYCGLVPHEEATADHFHVQTLQRVWEPIACSSGSLYTVWRARAATSDSLHLYWNHSVGSASSVRARAASIPLQLYQIPGRGTCQLRFRCPQSHVSFVLVSLRDICQAAADKAHNPATCKREQGHVPLSTPAHVPRTTRPSFCRPRAAYYAQQRRHSYVSEHAFTPTTEEGKTGIYSAT